MGNKGFSFINILSAVVITAFVFVAAQAGLCAHNLEDDFLSDLELKGTVVTNSFGTIAIIKDKTKGMNAIYEIGDTICGANAKIINIERGKVVFEKEGVTRTLSFPLGSVMQAQLDLDMGGVNFAQKEGAYIISREDVNNLILSAGNIARSVKIAPYFEKGRPAGMRLSNIKKGTVLEKAGLNEADVLKAVNNLKIATPYQIFDAYKKLKNNTSFEVEVLREGKPITLTYKIE
ncbi:MAG TPA: hypothetical protein ENN18_07340 [Proteobacteria bacterium]|nr:hypothetical protein [Pseudomonadota bacterium]